MEGGKNANMSPYIFLFKFKTRVEEKVVKFIISSLPLWSVNPLHPASSLMFLLDKYQLDLKCKHLKISKTI